MLLFSARRDDCCVRRRWERERGWEVCSKANECVI